MQKHFQKLGTKPIKFICIAVHADMRVDNSCFKSFRLRLFDFDTILISVYTVAMAMPRPGNGFRPILKIACDNDADVIIMNVVPGEGIETVKNMWHDMNYLTIWMV